MLRKALRVLPLAAAIAAFGVPASAQAATIEVCESGCDHDSLSAAVVAAADGDTIEIAAGTYVEDEGVDIDKGLTIVGAGSGETIIDGTGAIAPGQTGQLEIRTGSGQDVSVSGLTVRDPVASDTLRIGIFSKSMATPGPDHTFTDVAIEGVGDASPQAEYGLWTFHSTADLVFADGSVSGVKFNPFLIESPVAGVTISGSEIAGGTGGGGVFFMTAVNGEDSNGPQRVTGNELDGASVSFNSGFTAGAGDFGDVEISDNRLDGAGISLQNRRSDGENSVIVAPVVTGNVVTGNGSSNGLNIAGIVTDAAVTGNVFDGFATGVRAGKLFDNSPPDIALHANRIVNNGTGVVNAGDGSIAAEENWWGCNEGPGEPGCNGTSGDVSSDPWLTLDLAGPDAVAAQSATGNDATLTGTSAGGEATDPGAFPGGQVEFGASDGAIDSPEPLAASVASTTFTAPNWNGPVTLEATFDNETVQRTVDVGGAPLAPTRIVARPMVLDDQPGLLRLITPLGRLTADVTNASTGEPLAGEEVVFRSRGQEVCRATTAANGRATCVVSFDRALLVILAGQYAAHYEGDANHEASIGVGKLARLLGLLEL